MKKVLEELLLKDQLIAAVKTSNRTHLDML